MVKLASRLPAFRLSPDSTVWPDWRPLSMIFAA
jgi:hypothetical protein